MIGMNIEERIRLEEQFISQNKKLSHLTEEEKQNFLILEENIREAINEENLKHLKRFAKSFPEIIDLLGIEKTVEIFEQVYNWHCDALLMDQGLCLSLLNNLHILFSACKGWCGGADDISEVPDIEEGHAVFRNDDDKEAKVDPEQVQENSAKNANGGGNAWLGNRVIYRRTGQCEIGTAGSLIGANGGGLGHVPGKSESSREVDFVELEAVIELEPDHQLEFIRKKCF